MLWQIGLFSKTAPIPMGLDYSHSENLHTLAGARSVLAALFQNHKPESLLDVGCGNGVWMRAALDFGVPEVYGLDGIKIPEDQLHVSAEKIRHQDLTLAWELNKRFDVVLCLEVAEHLDAAFAPNLIDCLVKHGSRIYFSAACPGQSGQHHVHCQWPAYWQQLFNSRGFSCLDDARWLVWNDEQIEPWYRQNMFVAVHDPLTAGQEPRLPPVIHPAIANLMIQKAGNAEFPLHVKQIENGQMPYRWYCSLPFRALYNKVRRRVLKLPR